MSFRPLVRPVGLAALVATAVGALAPVNNAQQVLPSGAVLGGSVPGANAKNAIFFVGDGMGVSTITATRVFSVGVAGELTVDTFPFTALSRTYREDAITPDSAPLTRPLPPPPTPTSSIATTRTPSRCRPCPRTPPATWLLARAWTCLSAEAGASSCPTPCSTRRASRASAPTAVTCALSLEDMTAQAIALLSGNPKGYVLVVESGRIDHAHHAGNAWRALTDTDQSIDSAVTGDVEVQGDKNGVPCTVLVYANGPGYRGVPRVDPFLDTFAGLGGVVPNGPAHPAYLQEAAVPLGSETHAGASPRSKAACRRPPECWHPRAWSPSCSRAAPTGRRARPRP